MQFATYIKLDSPAFRHAYVLAVKAKVGYNVQLIMALIYGVFY